MLQAYAPDATVVDVEDSAPIATPRTQTEDLTLQVHHSDRWHRRVFGERFTACGEPIVTGSSLRHEEYSGPLCDKGCFTAFELGRANEPAEPSRTQQWAIDYFRKDTDK